MTDSIHTVVERLRELARLKCWREESVEKYLEWQAATLLLELQAEVGNLKHDIERHIEIISEQESDLSRIKSETIEACALAALNERQYSNQLSYRDDASGYAEMAYEQACDDIASAIRSLDKAGSDKTAQSNHAYPVNAHKR